MNYDNLVLANLNIRIRSTIHRTADDIRYHAIISSTAHHLPLTEQFANAERAISQFIEDHRDEGLVPVFKRYYLSDPANQAHYIPSGQSCAVSVVGQAPLDYSKFAILVLLQSHTDVTECPGGLYAARHRDYTEYWGGGASSKYYNSYVATTQLLSEYDALLRLNGCSLADNCLRTWLFVRDIDNNYSGVVKARNDIFEQLGLTRDTHFISSTGIEGNNPDPHRTVTFDSYAVSGIRPSDITYLHAYDHLNPTAEYGVAFERGTAVDLPDGHRRVIISGTASINNKGEIVFPGDIERQTKRMMENINALLDEGGCTFDDVAHAIVYLRDPADYPVVQQLIPKYMPNVPYIIVHAPVCRPGWLIEMECMAVK